MIRKHNHVLVVPINIFQASSINSLIQVVQNCRIACTIFIESQVTKILYWEKNFDSQFWNISKVIIRSRKKSSPFQVLSILSKELLKIILNCCLTCHMYSCPVINLLLSKAYYKDLVMFKIN